ncbi:MAG: PKD domain-containing protein, partial [Halobacteriovoraceae bacterium]|nr:PKD domain-containing protein [Halobacteriovoraceae bacterium]
QLPEFNFLSSNFQSSTFPFLVTTSISGEVDFDGTVTEIVQYSGDPLGPDMAFGNSGSFNYFKPGTYFQKAVVRDDFDEARLKERAVYVGPEEAPLIGVFPIQTGPFEVKMDSLIKGRYDKNSLIWDFGDGQFSNEIAPTHTYSSSGTYLVKVYYFDVYGNYTSADREIYIDGNNYDPVIVSDLPFYQEISPGTSISFDISGSNDPGGNPLDGSVVDFKTGNLAIDTTTGSETFNDVGFYDVTVYVVNDKGMTTKESVYVNVISGDGPQPVGSVDISSGSAPLTFTLDATGSFHNSGTITESLWKSNSLPNEFGLPIGTPNQIETLTLESPGVYDFELWVRDNLGNTRQQTISVEVTN